MLALVLYLMSQISYMEKIKELRRANIYAINRIPNIFSTIEISFHKGRRDYFVFREKFPWKMKCERISNVFCTHEIFPEKLNFLPTSAR